MSPLFRVVMDDGLMDDIDELLVLGPQKILGICCTLYLLDDSRLIHDKATTRRV